MALSTTYITVPFLEGAHGALYPGAPRRSPSRRTAIAAADGLAPFYAGAIVLGDRNDLAASVFLEPLLIHVVGSVPKDLLSELAAA
jgi:hypothetical protein